MLFHAIEVRVEDLRPGDRFILWSPGPNDVRYIPSPVASPGRVAAGRVQGEMMWLYPDGSASPIPSAFTTLLVYRPDFVIEEMPI